MCTKYLIIEVWKSSGQTTLNVCDMADCVLSIQTVSLIWPKKGKVMSRDCEDTVIFKKPDLPICAFPLIADIRRQGKLCDVTLKVCILLATIDRHGRFHYYSNYNQCIIWYQYIHCKRKVKRLSSNDFCIVVGHYAIY